MGGNGYLRELLGGRRTGLADRALLACLAPLSVVYSSGVQLRAAAYARGVLPTRRLDRPVISVGNLTAGGTGKTPMAACVARMLLSRGKRVVLLSRGYGGTLEGREAVVSDGERLFLAAEEAGDEPVLLARSVPGLAVVIGADRHRAGLLARERLDPDVFLLDDGFQHLRLHRDLNILLLDCTNPFGTGLTLPAGLLREPRSALSRADLVIFTRCRPGVAPAVRSGLPSCRAEHALVGVRPLSGEGVLPFGYLGGRKGFAFAGIAEPADFFEEVRRAGLALVGTRPLPDHSRYDDQTVTALAAAARAVGADYFITTEKDAVKIDRYLPRLGETYAACLELRLEDAGPLEMALNKIL
ncbi:tetraacyldisaccharide 4'-kinase [Geobacter pickeringii]|uniref:Tetraacyldisaccharide 4'-kinase n=1 Tax=Geobacter pickeringii TaxID=345632 RepID=A0A0B5BGR9_9BACT|nr:tetraacyldisaccharide 4'-kinase [Geobacter pickeringii]AJE03715.1 tetraacyldisaccharide 4'-kinase [Geobacter pickeringii]